MAGLLGIRYLTRQRQDCPGADHSELLVRRNRGGRVGARRFEQFAHTHRQ